MMVSVKRAISGAVECPYKLGIVLVLLAGMWVYIPVARACSWSYLIWAIRRKPADPLFRFVKDGKAGYIDAAGKVVIDAVLPADSNFGGEFHEGLLAVKEKRGYRYVDRSGTVVFQGDYWMAFDFSEGLAQASTDAGKSGFIDRTGRFAVAPEYWRVDPFSEGLARVSVSGEFGSTGYIDRTGTFVIPPRLTYGADFHEGLAAVIIGGPCRLMNGGSCSRAEFQPMLKNATYDCRYTFIDKSGKPVSDRRFDDAKDFSEGFAPVRIGRWWGYVDRSGQIAIAPRFDSAETFSEGLAAVSQGSKTGFINPSGKFVIAPTFQSADSFSDGRAVVSDQGLNGKSTYRFIDKTGNPAFPGIFTLATSFSYGVAHVAYEGTGRSGKFGWINTSGKSVFTYSVRDAKRP